MRKPANKAAALRQYDVCVDVLANEFDAPPSPETRDLLEQIKQGTKSFTPSGTSHKTPALVIGGRYEIADRAQDLLGQGSMGRVFKCRDTQTDEIVAIKALRAETLVGQHNMLERFAREAKALRQLNHPNIVQMLDTVSDGDEHYIVMQYVAGGSLQSLLDRSDPLPLEQVMRIALELCDALTQAHYRQIIHRDIKPANILLGSDGSPLLTDFGVARLGQAERVTRTGAAVGTLDYLSPEALNGHAVDVQTDIWSLGVTLYELLVGQRPFIGDTLTEVLAAILTQATPDLAAYRQDIPPALADLIGRMLQKDPQKRISSVRSIGAELEAVMQGRLGSTGDIQTRPDDQPQETEDVFLHALPRPHHNLLNTKYTIHRTRERIG